MNRVVHSHVKSICLKSAPRRPLFLAAGTPDARFQRLRPRRIKPRRTSDSATSRGAEVSPQTVRRLRRSRPESLSRSSAIRSAPHLSPTRIAPRCLQGDHDPPAPTRSRLHQGCDGECRFVGSSPTPADEGDQRSYELPHPSFRPSICVPSSAGPARAHVSGGEGNSMTCSPWREWVEPVASPCGNHPVWLEDFATNVCGLRVVKRNTRLDLHHDPGPFRNTCSLSGGEAVLSGCPVIALAWRNFRGNAADMSAAT